MRTRGAPPLGGLADGWTRRRPAGVEGRGLYASRLRALHLGYELCISATSCTQTPSAAGQGQASRTSTEMGECVHAPHGFTVRFMHCRVRDGRGRGHVLRTDGWYTHTLSVGTRTAFYKRGGGICAEPWSDFVDVVSVLVTRRVRVCGSVRAVEMCNVTSGSSEGSGVTCEFRDVRGKTAGSAQAAAQQACPQYDPV